MFTKAAFIQKYSKDCNSDYICMDSSNLLIDLILNKTIFWLRCLHQLFLEYSFHVPVLHVIEHGSMNGTRHYIPMPRCPTFPPEFHAYSLSLLWYHIKFWRFIFNLTKASSAVNYLSCYTCTLHPPFVLQLKMSPFLFLQPSRHFIISISFRILNMTIVSRLDQKCAFLLEAMLSCLPSNGWPLPCVYVSCHKMRWKLPHDVNSVIKVCTCL